jgi:hypothetical protein
MGAGKNFVLIPESAQKAEVDRQDLSKETLPEALEQFLKKQNRSMTQSAQSYLINTVIERGVSDTTTTTYTYFSNGLMSFGTNFPHREAFTYDASGRALTDIHQESVNGQWTNWFGDSTTYDAHGNVLTQSSNSWVTSTGVLFSSTCDTNFYTYDAQGYVVLDSGIRYQSGKWALSWKSIITHDANGNELGYLLTDVDSLGGQPDSTFYRGTYTYDAHGNLLTFLREQTQNIRSGLWVPLIIDTASYDTNGKRSKLNVTTYNSGQLTWQYDYTWAYDTHGNILRFDEMELDVGQLVYQDSDMYAYNTNEQMLTHSHEQWTNGQSVESLITSSTYDKNGNLDSVSTIGLQNSLWVPSVGSVSAVVGGRNENFSGYVVSFKYELAGITGVPSGKSSIPSRFSLLQNYPNPFNPTTTIRFTVSENGFTSLKLYNVLGQEVATLVNTQLKAGSYEKTFDARNLASGVYVYRLQSGQFNEVKKLMVLK